MAVVLVALGTPIVVAADPAWAVPTDPISGAGSTWAQNAVELWKRDVQTGSFRISYSGTGSTDGRRRWLDHLVDFAVSDVPFQANPEDGSPPEIPQPGSYGYAPIVAGGTAFAYQLRSNGERITNLRLSGENIARIFTGGITNWDDPAIAADNPGLTLPHLAINPVIQSDASRPSYQLTQWMISQHNALWGSYCLATGQPSCSRPTELYPAGPGMVTQLGQVAVTAYIAETGHDGAIGPVDYAYALSGGLPVAKVLNTAGYYVEPTAESVALSLLDADIETDPGSPDYLTAKLDRVYANADPRAYPLSSYAYLIVGLAIPGPVGSTKAASLLTFTRWAMCDGQRSAGSFGYAPLPVNLVQATFQQMETLLAADPELVDTATCNNPTMRSGQDVLFSTVPLPPACDRAGSIQCDDSTGGTRPFPPPVVPEAPWPLLLSASAFASLLGARQLHAAEGRRWQHTP